jgi:hypothetical protein
VAGVIFGERAGHLGEIAVMALTLSSAQQRPARLPKAAGIHGSETRAELGEEDSLGRGLRGGLRGGLRAAPRLVSYRSEFLVHLCQRIW